MTYYEKYSAAREKCDLEAMVKDDAIFVWLCIGNNEEDRLKAIEDAANKVLRERGWDSHE